MFERITKIEKRLMEKYTKFKGKIKEIRKLAEDSRRNTGEKINKMELKIINWNCCGWRIINMTKCAKD